MNAWLLRSEVRAAGCRGSPGPACNPNGAEGVGGSHLLQPLKAACVFDSDKATAKAGLPRKKGQFSKLQWRLYDHMDTKWLYRPNTWI